MYKHSALILTIICIALLLVACPNNPDGNGDTDLAKTVISGRAIFANSYSSGTITVYLSKTDGLYVESIQPTQSLKIQSARNIQNGNQDNQGNHYGWYKKTTTNPDGSFSFDDVDDGIYTVYATSEDESEQDVIINIQVEGNPDEETTEISLETMTLKPVGSIIGRVILDGTESNNLGFTVFIGGTSYSSITGSSGNFEISNVPAGSGYEIAVMKGNYVTIWTISKIESEEVTDIGQFDVTTADLNGDAMIWKGALTTHPANPQKNWAYFNLNGKITYIYDGTEWVVMAQVISTNNVVYNGNGNTGGTVPVDPGNYVYGIFVPVMGKGDLVKEGYRFGGWSLNSEGIGTIYQPEETIRMTDTQINFFAVWLQLYTINYDGNGNDNGTAPNAIEVVAGENITIASSGDLEKDGYRFIGWSTSLSSTSSEYSAGSTYIAGVADITLYAVWAKLFTITYHGNGNTGGTVPNGNSYIAGEQISISGAGSLTKTNNFFVGWNTKQDATGTAYFQNNIMTMNDKDIILYAIWSEYNMSNGTITGYSGLSKDIIIPSVINTVPITAIGSEVFWNYSLTSVVIPNTITTIGNRAFYASQLLSVIIPDSVIIIGGEAFMSNQLDSINIPYGVTTIGENAFSDNLLTTVNIPNSITIINGGAFANNRLTSVIIPNSVTAIGWGAFANNRLTSVIIPDSVTTIGGSAFRGNQLLSIDIPNSVTTIEESAFSYNQLSSAVISSSVTIIGDYAFYNNKLTSVIIPNSVTTIGSTAFALNLLTSVIIPDSVTTIGNAAFVGNLLTSVTIPGSVTTIGESAFRSNLLTLINLHDGITRINSGAFSDNQLTSIILPNSIIFIGEVAFSNNQIISITIPSDVNIDNYDFSDAMGAYGDSFKSYYDDNGKRAGTYTYNEETEAWSAVFSE